MTCVLYISAIVPVLIIIIYTSLTSITDICEPDTCPYCYGENFCEELKFNTTLDFSSFSYWIFNLLSVKNVYFANFKSIKVVIKKLGQRSKLEMLKVNRKQHPTLQNLNELILNNESNQLHFCDSDVVKLFLYNVVENFVNTWTIFKVNPEPLLLKIFKKEMNWPTPKLFGYCGLCMVVENNGIPLNQIASINWYNRAYVAFQLLEALENFTFAHQSFRLYLTDISPDNIVVNTENFQITFVDLEHAVLKQNTLNESFHYTSHMSGEDYAFSVNDVCSKDISDHNIYSVCRLILSKDAPYPMMSNGLLHSPPPSLKNNDLFRFIELCVDSEELISRFHLSLKIKNIIQTLLQSNYSLY